MSESPNERRKHKLPECREGKQAARAFEATMRGLIAVPKSRLAKLEKQNGKHGK